MSDIMDIAIPDDQFTIEELEEENEVADRTVAYDVMHSIIQRVATGPEYSKDISQQEAYLGMRYLLKNKIDPVQSAIFLIALRMKRETIDENIGILKAISESVNSMELPLDNLVHIADPYNGFDRTLPSSPFVPVVLAEFGIPAYCHGLESVAPKYGLTHRHILRAAGIPVDLSVEEAKDRLMNPDLGWTYIDQHWFCPALHDLVELRSQMVKRTILTTAETLLAPFQAKKNHLVNGYVHKAYPPVYAALANSVDFDSLLLIRGNEGGTTPSLRQETQHFHYYDDIEQFTSIKTDPKTLGIKQKNRAAVPSKETINSTKDGVPTEAMAREAAELGLAALVGDEGAYKDGLVYTSAIILWHLKKFASVQEAATQVSNVLESGSLLARFN
jgi:anthranilate phosphoribosyltransferase